MLRHMGAAPGATITFLFSDIEGSTELVARLGDAYAEVLSDHRRILRGNAADHRGQEIDTQGDSFFFSFPRARDAVAAAVAAQRELAEHSWRDGVRVRVRMGIHTGEPSVADEGFVGLDVVRAARIAAIGHGGQVLISDVTRALVRTDLPEGVTVRSLGAQRLRGLDEPEPVHELVIDGLSEEHPPLRAEAADDPGAGIRAAITERTQRLPEEILGGLERDLAADPDLDERLERDFAADPDVDEERPVRRRTPWPLILVALIILTVLGAVPIVSILANR
jgi:class 3 adenylate cyclase